MLRKTKKRKEKSPKSDASARVGRTIGEDSWRAALEAIAINDENWWCMAIMMIETITEHARCVSLFNVGAEEGKRRTVYSLNHQKTLATVRALSKQELDKSPTIQGVCHYASKLLNENGATLPSWLMARVIKYLIHRAKEDSIGIAKKRAELERDIDEEYRIMQSVANVEARIGRTRRHEDEARSKANTRLRKRGEEWRDAIYVDDSPLNGPNFYVILTGFHDPDLPAELRAAGVPLTCILRIQRSNEKLHRPPSTTETIHGVSTEMARKRLFFQSYTIGRRDLFKFWSTIEGRLENPEAHPVYNDIAFLTFCPPEIPEASDEVEYEDLKRDMYDRVSYVAYDLYDLYRQHGNYLKSMRVEKGFADHAKDEYDRGVYEAVLNAIPRECSPVPTLLWAILLQVEANVAKPSLEESSTKEENVVPEEQNKLEAEEEPSTPSEYPDRFVKEKLQILNAKYHLADDYIPINDELQDPPDCELILHGDALEYLQKVYEINIPRVTHFVDDILGIFQIPKVAKLWEKHEALSPEKLETYSRHLSEIRRYFKIKISEEEIKHYLHALAFDKMIFGAPLKRKDQFTAAAVVETEMKIDSQSRNEVVGEDRSNLRSGSNISLPEPPKKLHESVPALTAKWSAETRSKSDTYIDYDKSIAKCADCSPLFDLMDPRELLVPGYLKRNIFDKRRHEQPALEEFEQVEPLSNQVFLQVVYECLLGFDRFEAEYFEPTDSVLLRFAHDYEVEGVKEETTVVSIRTPVCFREFCEYVIREEEDWIKREEEAYRLETTESTGRLMTESSEKYDETIFLDEHFILPGSLKARDLQRSEDPAARRKNFSGTDLEETGENAKLKRGQRARLEEIKKKTKERGGRGGSNVTRMTRRGGSREKTIGKDESSERKSEFEEDGGGDTDASVLTRRRSSSERHDEAVRDYEFVGYDLGKLRVQVTNRGKTFFSADGTRVRVEIDEWLYKNRDLRITVTLRGCSLRLFHGIGARENTGVFHLTTKTGIILAFRKLPGQRKDVKSSAGIFKYFLTTEALRAIYRGVDAAIVYLLVAKALIRFSAMRRIEFNAVIRFYGITSDDFHRFVLRHSKTLSYGVDITIDINGTFRNVYLGASMYSEYNWRDIDVEFRISWPSGLLIEPIAGDGTENPFYIRQYYVARGEDNKGGTREVCRKFLRNGTVLKYLSDGSIIVLRPNGTIVTCTDFEEVEVHDDKKSDDQTVTTKGDRPRKESKQPLKQRRRPTNSFKSQLPEVAEEDPAVTRKNSRANQNRGSFLSMEETPAMFRVSRYTVVNHDGRRYEVLDDLVVSEHHRLLVRTASDYEVNEKFTRRADGTDMLLNPNGELIVSFPDGTRITTGFTIEKEPVMCDWTEEEILRYFVSRGTEEAFEYGSTSSSNPKFPEDGSSRQSTEHSDEMTEILIADSFVSVLLTCRIEHKNYATVLYDQSAVNCTLSMPDDLRVSISRRGHYELRIEGEVNLKTREDGLTFARNVCATCGGQSTSTYVFPDNDCARTLFTSVDVFGNVLEVEGDGTTRYREKSRPPMRRKFNGNENVTGGEADEGEEEGDGEESYEEAESAVDKTSGHEGRCDHGEQLDEDRASRSRYRIFAMNRNLTAHEYLHRSVARETEVAAVYDNETSVIAYPISRRPELRRLITFEPVELQSRSKAALLPFWNNKIKPTNFDRRELVRSTYSIPYDWLFPFGKHGDGIWNNNHDVPLAVSTARAIPKLLKIRVLYGFKKPDVNPVIDLQEALGHYWMSLVRGTTAYRISTEAEAREVTASFQNLENDLLDLALGIKRKIDAATYTRGLEKRYIVPSPEDNSESSEFNELLEQMRSKKKEIDWYKFCMSKRIVVPYFQNIAGSCFLWVQDCVERSLEISRINTSAHTISGNEVAELSSSDADTDPKTQRYLY